MIFVVEAVVSLGLVASSRYAMDRRLQLVGKLC